MQSSCKRIGQSTVDTPNAFEVVLTRFFDAPRDRVFDAWTRPDWVRRWLLGPPGWSMSVCEIDLRPGGDYRYVWTNGTGREFGMDGTFRDVDRPAGYVATERFGGGEALVTNRFEDVDGRTRCTHTMRFASQAERDAAIATGMNDGIEASYTRLDPLLQAPGA